VFSGFVAKLFLLGFFLFDPFFFFLFGLDAVFFFDGRLSLGRLKSASFGSRIRKVVISGASVVGSGVLVVVVVASVDVVVDVDKAVVGLLLVVNRFLVVAFVDFNFGFRVVTVTDLVVVGLELEEVFCGFEGLVFGDRVEVVEKRFLVVFTTSILELFRCGAGFKVDDELLELI
jgi:hypothetical protein